MNIYIPIEVKARELEGKILLALTAAERGHTVILGDKSDTRGLASKGVLPPGIVHNKSLTPGDKTIKLIHSLIENGHVITSQDEESGLLDESYDEFAKIRFSEESVSEVAKIFAWGDHDAESLKRIHGKYQDRVVATGSPRVDFWRDEFSGFYNTNPFHESHLELKPFILISSNFGSFLNQNRFFNVVARLRKAGYFDRDPDWERHQYENAAYQTRLIHEFVIMIRKLSETFPDHTILVRPHPIESEDGWKKILGDYPNIKVLREGGVNGWVRNASVMIHNGCTTAIEAAAAGLPRIAYRPIPSDIEREIPNKMSYNVFSLKELVDQVSEILDGNMPPGSKKIKKTADQVLSARFNNLSGKLAADRIVDEWEDAGKSLNGHQASPNELIALKNEFEKKSTGISKLLKRTLANVYKATPFYNRKKNSTDKLLTSKHKFPSFLDQEMEILHTNLKNTLHRFENVEIKRFGRRSFVLVNSSQ